MTHFREVATVEIRGVGCEVTYERPMDGENVVDWGFADSKELPGLVADPLTDEEDEAVCIALTRQWCDRCNEDIYGYDD